jgi:hypothetical protein
VKFIDHLADALLVNSLGVYTPQMQEQYNFVKNVSGMVRHFLSNSELVG